MEDFSGYVTLIGFCISVVSSKEGAAKESPEITELSVNSAIQHLSVVWSSSVFRTNTFRFPGHRTPVPLKDYIVFLFNVSSLPNLFTFSEQYTALESIAKMVNNISVEADQNLKSVTSMILERLIFRLESAQSNHLAATLNSLAIMAKNNIGLRNTLIKQAKTLLLAFSTYDEISRFAICKLVTQLQSITAEIFELVRDLVRKFANSSVSDKLKAALIHAYSWTLIKMRKDNLGQIYRKVKQRYEQTKVYEAKKEYLSAISILMNISEDTAKDSREFLMKNLQEKSVDNDFIYYVLVKDVIRTNDPDQAYLLVRMGYHHVVLNTQTSNQYVFKALCKLGLKFTQYKKAIYDLVHQNKRFIAFCPPGGHKLTLGSKPEDSVPIEFHPDLWPPLTNGRHLMGPDTKFVYKTRNVIYQVPIIRDFNMFSMDEGYEPVDNIIFVPQVPAFLDQLAMFISILQNKNRIDEFLPIASVIFHDSNDKQGRTKVSNLIITYLDKFAGSCFIQLFYSIILQPDMLETRFGKEIISQVIANFFAFTKVLQQARKRN